MKKQRLFLEYELMSNSPAIIWKLMSTAEGLALWIADEVTMDDKTCTLAWGNPLMHYDSRQLNILECVKQSHIRMQWVDETDPEAYLEMRMEKSELTGDYMLLVTDYGEPEEMQLLNDIWDDNLSRLHHSSGV